MNIKLIDQGLNIAIAGLIYGTEAWFLCAFSLYVAARRAKANAAASLSSESLSSESLSSESSLTSLSLESSEAPAVADQSLFSESSSMVESDKAVEIPVNDEISKKMEPGILEISIVHAVPARASVVETQFTEAQFAEAQFTEAHRSDRKLIPEAIACEPVNWKKWKLSDLRATNIAKECGVKTQPIGSRRNLNKADLVAQYEQNLKRLTKAPPKQADREKKKAERSKIA
jgi:hypothetical protein